MVDQVTSDVVLALRRHSRRARDSPRGRPHHIARRRDQPGDGGTHRSCLAQPASSRRAPGADLHGWIRGALPFRRTGHRQRSVISHLRRHREPRHQHQRRCVASGQLECQRREHIHSGESQWSDGQLLRHARRARDARPRVGAQRRSSSARRAGGGVESFAVAQCAQRRSARDWPYDSFRIAER
jgi:hypothetical protein